MKPHALITLFILLTLPLSVPAETVLKCTDSRGRPAFTDDPRKCGAGVVESREIKLLNSHGQYGRQTSKEYFNYASRRHTPLKGYKIQLIVESELLETDPELTHKAAKRLEYNVLKALGLFPQVHRSKFENIRFYLFNGSRSSYGGKDSGLWYFGQRNRISPRFDDSIIVNSADNYAHISDQWALISAIHELAHGFNHYQWQRINRLQTAAFKNSQGKKRYQQVPTQSGRPISKAYALENAREYFAELSVMYFARHYYSPYDNAGLATYDPEGYALLQKAWFEVDAQPEVPHR